MPEKEIPSQADLHQRPQQEEEIVRQTIPLQAPRRRRKKSFLKKAFPYLLAGGTTGVGITAAVNSLLS